MPVAQEVKSFLEDECGAELVEWAVVTVILLAATAGVLLSIQGRIAGILIGTLQDLAGP